MNHASKRVKRAVASEKVVNNAPTMANHQDTGTENTGCSPVIDTVTHSSSRDRPEWEAAGRVAYRQKRPFTLAPYGIAGLTVEGLIRSAAWSDGWRRAHLEATATGKRARKAATAAGGAARVKTADV